MRGKILIGGCALLAAAMLIAACGSKPGAGSGEKIALINWEQAVKEHPEYQRFAQGEKILKDLLEKRKAQEELAKAQLSSLDKLQQLKRISRQGYFDAELNTKIAEQHAREQAALQKYLTKLEPEADQLIAGRKKEVEDSYQLKIFNLRAVLETVKLRPDERQDVEAKLRQAKAEREVKLSALEAEKRAYMDSKLKPYMEQVQKRLQEQLLAYKEQQSEKMADIAAKDKASLGKAPLALQNALAIMDREIDKQQEKNDSLKSGIAKNIESIATKLAHERGYTIVFNRYKVNMKAEDITADVVKEIKNTKNK